MTGIEREGMNNIMYDRYKDDVNYIVEVRGDDDVEGLLQRRTVNKMKNIVVTYLYVVTYIYVAKSRRNCSSGH